VIFNNNYNLSKPKDGSFINKILNASLLKFIAKFFIIGEIIFIPVSLLFLWEGITQDDL